MEFAMESVRDSAMEALLGVEGSVELRRGEEGRSGRALRRRSIVVVVDVR